MTYRTIKTEFTKDGFAFQQIKREGDWAIYRQSKSNLKSEWFEVVRISRHDGFYIHGVAIEPSETYPASEAWGKSGFTCTSMEEAESRLRSELSNPSPKRKN